MSKSKKAVYIISFVLATFSFLALICVIPMEGDWWYWVTYSLLGLFLVTTNICIYIKNPHSFRRHAAASLMVIIVWCYRVLKIKSEIGYGGSILKENLGTYLDLYNYTLVEFDKNAKEGSN